jgi:hypothetical protein
MKTTPIIISSSRLWSSPLSHPGDRTTLLCRTLAIVLSVLAVFHAPSAKAQDSEPMEPQEVTLQAWCESVNGEWSDGRCTVRGAATLAFGYRLIIDRREKVIITSTGIFTNKGETSNRGGGILNDGLMILTTSLLSEGEFENNGTLNIYRLMNNREELTNKGTINIFAGAKLTNQHLIHNYGTINNNGSINNRAGQIQNICFGNITGNSVDGTEPVSVGCTFSLTNRLEEGIENGRLPSNRANSLLAVVKQVQALIDNGNPSAACHLVNAFIAQVNALLNTGAISERTGGTLLEEANLLKQLLGC